MLKLIGNSLLGAKEASILACVISALISSPVFSTPVSMVIDWSVCKQPDLNGVDHKQGTDLLISRYVQAAKKPTGTHIAVGLSREYGVAVQERRDHVRLSYISLGPNRTKEQCALSDADYAKLLQYRDASYYIMCRSEVAIGGNAMLRTAKDVKASMYSAIYDFSKATGLYEMRAKPDEPMTPPGGFAACSRGTDDGKNDPFPTETDLAKFKTRLTIPDSEKTNVGDPTKQ